MKENDKDFWFPAKKYGFGWGLPVKWQGWMVLLVYAMLVAVGFVILGRSENSNWFYIYFSFLTAILIVICLIKGEKAKWRWGNKE